jgi:hypothetical protein
MNILMCSDINLLLWLFIVITSLSVMLCYHEVLVIRNCYRRGWFIYFYWISFSHLIWSVDHVYLSIYPLCLSIYLYIRYVYLSIYPLIHNVHLSIHHVYHLSIYLHNYLPIYNHLSIYLLNHLSNYLRNHLSIYLHNHLSEMISITAIIIIIIAGILPISQSYYLSI